MGRDTVEFHHAAHALHESFLHRSIILVRPGTGGKAHSGVLLVEHIAVEYSLEIGQMRAIDHHAGCILPCTPLICGWKDGIVATYYSTVEAAIEIGSEKFTWQKCLEFILQPCYIPLRSMIGKACIGLARTGNTSIEFCEITLVETIESTTEHSRRNAAHGIDRCESTVHSQPQSDAC